MVGIAVHLMQLQIGINIVKDVNAFSQQLQQSLQLLLLKMKIVTQVGQVMIIVMTVTIHVKAILMAVIAVHLMY